MVKSSNRNKGSTIIIRKEEIVEGGHHGGAWKVAYADFVTAMMAFFLLMWLLNATTEEQRRGLADYFSPMNIFGKTLSGSGAPFGGSSPNDAGQAISQLGQIDIVPGPQPVQVEEEDDSETPAQLQQHRDGGEDPQQYRDGGPQSQQQRANGASNQPNATGGDYARESARASEAALRAELARREDEAFTQAAATIRESVAADPSLAEFSSQLSIDRTPEGLRIQILDADNKPMFALSSAAPNERTRQLLAKIVPTLVRLPNDLSIAGHTDSTRFRGNERGNWELSTERANATRRILIESGLPEARIRNVTGNADRDPLLRDNPMGAANRRVAIVVLRAAGPSTTEPSSP